MMMMMMIDDQDVDAGPNRWLRMKKRVFYVYLAWRMECRKLRWKREGSDALSHGHLCDSVLLCVDLCSRREVWFLSLSLSLSLFPYLSIYPFPISRDREIFSQKWASHSLELHKWASPSKISSSVHEPPTLSLSLSHSRMNHTRILPFANVSIIRVW